jgi:hypothetical protein
VRAYYTRDDCCGIGRLRNRWGLFSFSFFQRLAGASPEFEQVTTFQVGWGRMNVRHQGALAGTPLTSEYVTGNYFSTLGVRAHGGRLRVRDRERSQHNGVDYRDPLRRPETAGEVEL